MLGRGLLVLLCWVLSIQANAQDPLEVPTLPPSALPGRIPQQIELPPELEEIPGPLIDALPSLQAPPGAKSIQLRLSSVEVEGVTVYAQAELEPLYASAIGQEITLHEVFEIADRITNQYRNDGYILAQTIVKGNRQLDVTDAHIVLEVVEGFIGQIVYEDAAIQNDEKGQLIKAYLEKIPRSCKTERAKETNKPCPLHKDILERYLLLAKDLPGVDVETVLIKGEETGSANLFVTVKQKFLEAFGAVDNRGTEWVGPVQLSAGVRGNFSNYHSTELQLRTATESQELQLVNLTHSLPVGSEGGEITVFGSYSRSQPGYTLDILDIETDNVNLLASYEYPVQRTREKNLSLFTDFKFIEQETDALGVIIVDDRLSVLSAGFRYDSTDAHDGGGVNLFELRVSQGLNVFNPTQDDSLTASRIGGDPTFTKIFGYAARLQRINDRSSYQLQIGAQYSFDNLFVPMQFGYGGTAFGRAYDPSELIGDSGAALSLEYRYTPVIKGIFPKAAQLYAYYDVGAVWQRDAACGCNEVEDGSGASIGAGVRVNFNHSSSGSLEIGKPLTREVAAEGNKDPRIFLSLSMRY